MRKNILSAAVVAAMGGVAGVANAVNVNPDGTGEVLLYPYYSVENGNDTYINVVNTTDQVKMVKVRFREAMNSQEVLDFNLYMSPHDEWSGAISATADGGAQFNSEDNSCTTPMNVSDVAFRTFKFDGTLGDEDSVSGVERTRTGYVELIEMAEIDPTSAFGQAVTHDSDGVADCGTANGYVGNGGQLQGVTLSEPAGGLYGFGMLVNVDRATDVQYDAVALDGVYSSPSNAGTGSDDPSLADALGDRGALGFQLTSRIVAVKRGAGWIGQRNLNIRAALFKAHRDAGERAARADRAGEAVDPAVGLLP